ncbi:helix-turn-helix domain-containing protein [Litchfieldella anticariensis]|nr:XRE family transcriptional regulator [Halomonas anticariensis]
MANERFDSIWSAIEDSPEQAENMRVRVELMQALHERVAFWELTQREAAARLNINQPRLNDLFKGKISKFSLDALVNMTSAARLPVGVCLLPASIDILSAIHYPIYVSSSE